MDTTTARCPDCSQEFTLSPAVPDGSIECPYCTGTIQARSSRATPSSQTTGSLPDILSRWSGRLLKVTGVRRPEEFSWRETFSQVLSRRSDEEIERYFAAGGPNTTPALADIDVSWPKPWMFFRALVFSGVLYFLFLQAWEQFDNPNLLPGLIIVGSFAVPFSTLILFFELNVRRNISLYQIVKLVLWGGILSIIFTLLLYQLTDRMHFDWMGALLAGLVEEPGKLLALAFVLGNRRYRYTLNGLLLGAAVGTGFAAFESAGYALRFGIENGDAVMRQIILQRGLLSPFMHIAWTGMAAAALWRVKRDRPFTLQMLKDPRFVRVFAAAIVLHALWDTDFDLPFQAKHLFLGLVAWIIILGLVQEGLEELRAERSSAHAPEKPA